jgi:3-dehydroquinate synthase
MPASFAPRRSPGRGGPYVRLILLSVLLVGVLVAIWLGMRVASGPRGDGEPDEPGGPETPRNAAITPPGPLRPPPPATTRAGTSLPASAPTPAALPFLAAEERDLLAAVTDGNHQIDPPAIAALQRRAAETAPTVPATVDALNRDFRGRWVELVGTPVADERLRRAPLSLRSVWPDGLVRVPMRAPKDGKPFEVWTHVSIYTLGGGLYANRSYRVRGLFYKVWKDTDWMVVNTRTKEPLPPRIVPVIVAAPEAFQRATTGPRRGIGFGGLPSHAWILAIAAVVIFGYILLRLVTSMRSRTRTASAGAGGGGFGRLFGAGAPWRRPTTPIHEPADEKKIAAARVALEVAERLDAVPAIPVTTERRTYQIHVAPGLLERTGDMLATLVRIGRRVAVVTDENVGPLYGRKLRDALAGAGFTVTVLTVPAGEGSKRLEQAGRLYSGLLAADLDRDGLLVTLGGGMVGDLGGFVAATYMRGIDFVQVPTSLLAQVDASVGGKVAVNLEEGKNLVGAFHQPAAVIIDIDTLGTLPDADYASGLAEVVKHGVIREEALFDRLERQTAEILARDPQVMADVVAANCRIKAEVVSADEKESGLRAILNYGHTVGHAVEALGHYRLSHGAAVSLGMIAASHIAAAKGLIGEGQIARQRDLLAAFGLPVTLEQIDADAVLGLMRHDKKARGGRIRFVLPTRIGAVEIFDDVTDPQIRDALAALRP